MKWIHAFTLISFMLLQVVMLSAQQAGTDTIPYKIGKYDVKKQEPVFVIAQKINVDPYIIVSLNKLRNIKQDVVKGQRIKIPVYPKGYVYQPTKVVVHRSVDLDSAQYALLYKEENAQTPLQFFDPEEDNTKLMMLEATLELDEAMMQGLQASFDSLNVVDEKIDEKNTQATLRRMKRAREKVLLMPYLEAVRDSLTNDITLLKAEKKTIEERLNPTPAPTVKNDTVIEANDTIIYATTTFADNRPAEKVVASIVTKDEITKDDRTKIELKRNDKKSLKYKTKYALDTVIVYDLPSAMKPSPEARANNWATKNTAIWDTARALNPVALWDTARAVEPVIDSAKNTTPKSVDVRNDSTISIKIKNPTSSDSIIIKPILKPKPETKPSKPIVETVIIKDNTTTIIKEDTSITVVQQDTGIANKITNAILSYSISDTAIVSYNTSDVKGDTIKKQVVKPTVVNSTLAISDSIRKIKAEFFLKRSQKAMTEKNFRNAEQYLKKSIELYPTYYQAWFALAELDALFGSQQTAIKEYKICASIDSTQPKLYNNIGFLYTKMKRKTDAFAAYNKAIELDPANITALMARASIYNDWKKYDEAIMDYDKVLKTERSYHYAYKTRGQVKLMTREFKTAIDDFTRFLIFEETDPSAYYYRGLAKIGNGELLDGCLDLSTSSSMGYTAAEKAIKKSCE